MSKNIDSRSDVLDVTTAMDSDQQEAISREEEEEKKRLAQQREQEALISKESLNRDESDILEDEQLEPRLVVDDTKTIVENFGENGTTFGFSPSDLEITLQEDGAILKHEKGNPKNGYLINSDEGIVEYDFSNFDVSKLGKDEHAIKFTNSIGDDFDYEVQFNIDKEGNIEIDSVRGDAAGKINFKDGEKTYTLDKDGQLVEVADDAKELDKDNLDAALDGIDLSEMQGVKAFGDDREQAKEGDKRLDDAISELDLSEVKIAEHSSVPAGAETSEASRAR